MPVGAWMIPTLDDTSLDPMLVKFFYCLLYQLDPIADKDTLFTLLGSTSQHLYCYPCLAE
jgi:hypothetical protein